MAEKETYQRGTLTGRAYYAFLNKPNKDKENNKEIWKIELVLTNPDGSPIVVLDKKTGLKVDMLQRAKDYGLIIKEETKTIPGTYVRIKREKKMRVDPKTGETSPTEAPEVKGKGGINMNDKLIGNESLVQVDFTVFPIRQGAYKGKNSSAYLNSVLVHQLVEYTGSLNTEELEFDLSTLEDAKSSTPVKQTVNTDVDSDDIDEIDD